MAHHEASFGRTVILAHDLDAVGGQALAAGMTSIGEPGADSASRWRHLRDPLGNGIVLVQLAGHGARPTAEP